MDLMILTLDHGPQPRVSSMPSSHSKKDTKVAAAVAAAGGISGIFYANLDVASV